MRKQDAHRAEEFVHREGRLLERRILAATFEGNPAEPVAAALRGYQNADGGFGYGLEPDKAVPASQPLDVEVAWQSLDWAGLGPVPDLVERACDYLASVGPGVSCVTAAVQEHPHAPHWSGWSEEPSLNPTAGLAAFLWKWGIDHPWREAATSFCWNMLAGGMPNEAHTAIGVLRFLEHVPDRDRAVAAASDIGGQLQTMSWLHYDPASDGYGVSPLQLVPTPASPWVELFPPAIINGHLDAIESSQTPDGGWDITWPTIGGGAASAWRARLTVQNLLVLRAYDRLA